MDFTFPEGNGRPEVNTATDIDLKNLNHIYFMILIKYSRILSIFIPPITP